MISCFRRAFNADFHATIHESNYVMVLALLLGSSVATSRISSDAITLSSITISSLLFSFALGSQTEVGTKMQSLFLHHKYTEKYP